MLDDPAVGGRDLERRGDADAEKALAVVLDGMRGALEHGRVAGSLLGRHRVGIDLPRHDLGSAGVEIADPLAARGGDDLAPFGEDRHDSVDLA